MIGDYQRAGVALQEIFTVRLDLDDPERDDDPDEQLPGCVHRALCRKGAPFPIAKGEIDEGEDKQRQKETANAEHGERNARAELPPETFQSLGKGPIVAQAAPPAARLTGHSFRPSRRLRAPRRPGSITMAERMSDSDAGSSRMARAS